MGQEKGGSSGNGLGEGGGRTGNGLGEGGGGEELAICSNLCYRDAGITKWLVARLPVPMRTFQ